MAIDKVKNFFNQYNIANRIIELKESSATVELASQALGCNTNDIAKSLAFIVDKKPVLIITSGDARIDNLKYKNQFKTKAIMLKGDDVEKKIGHAIGGVCPFGINNDVIVYLDESLKNLKYVYPACGSSNSAIKLSISELEKYSKYHNWINVTKDNHYLS